MEHKKSYRIFLVDDDSFLLDMYSLKFKQAGHTVDIAKSGEEALRKLKEGLAPDIMLFDIIMPGIDGFEVLRRAKADPKTAAIPVVILSNLGEDADKAKGKELGAEEFVVKVTLLPDEVVSLVESVCGRHRGVK